MEKRKIPSIQHSSFLEEENQSHGRMHLVHAWLTPSKRQRCQLRRLLLQMSGAPCHCMVPYWPTVCEAPWGGKQFEKMQWVNMILQNSDTKSVISALTTGATGNVIDEDLTQQLQLELQKLWSTRRNGYCYTSQWSDLLETSVLQRKII